MAKRRRLRGKKLLVAAGIAGASLIGCEDETVANLVAPPDSGDQVDANTTEQDASFTRFDAAVANLVAPPDSGFDAGGDAEDGGSADDAGSAQDAGRRDAAAPSDAAVIGFPDAPVANLLPPPDGSF